ncbi:efflux RND transporter periplasmic adaptor subunit, partial [Escherichia coli]|uniref:efflux RND transporter periplasmic adaptor subunit n=1 Tax=Escherichia coli TaxID=562 RepID=UPI003BA3846C
VEQRQARHHERIGTLVVIDADAPEHAGQPVTLAADALPGQSFTGTVDRIAPVVDSGSGTFRVVSAFDGAAHALQPGMF